MLVSGSMIGTGFAELFVLGEAKKHRVSEQLFAA
jgi:hypothetical protein